jgi:hypothetical protein
LIDGTFVIGYTNRLKRKADLIGEDSLEKLSFGKINRKSVTRGEKRKSKLMGEGGLEKLSFGKSRIWRK